MTAAVTAGGVSGALFALSLPPFDAPAVAWVAFIPLFLVVEHGRLAEALAAAYATGLVVMSQVAYGLLTYDPRLWLACQLALPLWSVLPVALLRSATGTADGLWALAAPTLWVAGEVLAQEILRLPLDAGLSQARSAGPLQIASLVGTSGLTYLIVLTGALGGRALGRAWRAGPRWAWRPAMLATLLPCASAGLGWWMITRAPPFGCEARGHIVQPAISYDAGERSWTDPLLRDAVRTAFRHHLGRARQGGAPFVFWPEGGGAFESFRTGPVRDALRAEASHHRQHLIVSAVDFDEAGRKYNSVFAFTPDRAVAKYDKAIPVPGAEDDIQAGIRPGVVATEHGRMGVLVCFESCFPGPARSLAANGAAFLSVSTSDAAFGLSNLPDLHLSTSIARAVETGRSVVHASNAGPSGFIDPLGRVDSRTPLLARTSLDGCIVPTERHTVFTRHGHLFRAGCVLGAAGILALAVVRRIARRRPCTAGDVPRAATATALAVCALSTLPLTAVNALVVARGAGARAAPHHALPALVTWSKPPASTALRQSGPTTCGPTAIAYVASFYGAAVAQDDLARMVRSSDVGTSMAELVGAAHEIGFEAEGVRLSVDALRREPTPVIAHLAPAHFVVVLEVQGESVRLFDPSSGLGQVPVAVFEGLWTGKALRVRPPAVVFGARPRSLGRHPGGPRSAAAAGAATREAATIPEDGREVLRRERGPARLPSGGFGLRMLPVGPDGSD